LNAGHISSPDRKKAQQFEREQRSRGEEAGCFGLLAGSAFSEKLKKDVSADDATHDDSPFICRGCLSDAVLRKCSEKCDHYAHHARTSPAINGGETELHKRCLREICEALTTRYPNGNWATNREIPANKDKGLEKVVPDISGRIGNQRVVIEAQVSFLSISQIIKRSDVYSKRGIPILWIVPLREELGDKVFRPRLYERYLHTMYFGRVYYWLGGFGTLVQPVHYGVAERLIPHAEWYDKALEQERQVGGYEKPYKVIKRPMLGQTLDIATQFRRCPRLEFRPWNERKSVPPLVIWRDTLADWWDKTEDAEFRKQFKENPPPERTKRTSTKRPL
jgi:competence protein CoiA